MPFSLFIEEQITPFFIDTNFSFGSELLSVVISAQSIVNKFIMETNVHFVTILLEYTFLLNIQIVPIIL